MSEQSASDREWKAFEVEVADKVAEVRLIGPGKGNAMGPDFWRELPEVIEGLDADEEIRAIIITGSGKNFSYGLDLPAMSGLLAPALADNAKAKPRTQFHDTILDMQRAINAVADSRTPVVASISGWCIGGGVDLITAADIRYASDDAKFSVREVRVGMVADMGSLARLPAIIGDGHMRELALTGKDIDAGRAAAIGLVNEVAPTPEASLALARETAAQIAANPPLVVQGVKAVLDHTRSAAVADNLRYVAVWNAAFLPSDDLTEAISAVFEKRDPKFTGS
ncbi:crotonase/enoyl-CoA hydratase family protein [Gordonia otitidis]|uniref:crotonase/enoyl-CoA hydratase family protein n=1 Tax=Gordonia otitidis TaxID=249058 RepID=UPI001D1390C2|nr:crotonase/enoyl-CoA hydratase family protein [Gordonia otitidis]UEA58911.1 crotonase/enoyl-CoA hydratase family protein [Gordonia otitidis]